MQKSPLGIVASNGNIVSFADIADVDKIEQLTLENRHLTTKNQQLEATIAQLTARLQALAPNLAEILPLLLEAGLTAWCDRAVATYNESHSEGADSLMPLVAQLYAAATDNQISAVLALFGEVLKRSRIDPTPEEAWAMQAVLNAAQFPAELLSFRAWMHPGHPV